MPIELRPARALDAADIAAFHVRVWRVAYGHIAPPQIIDKLDYENRFPYWRTILETPKPRQHTLVALNDDTIIGFACFGPPSNPIYGNAGELKHLFIDPDHQGHGIGRRLFTAALKQLSLDGFKIVRLASTKENEPAIAFYHALGGTITGHFTDAGPIWKSQNLIMSWPLPFNTKP